MLFSAAPAADLASGLTDALAGAEPAWLALGLLFHLGSQLFRGVAWHGALSVPWPAVTRRTACAWYMTGAGLSGVLSGRGGDAVRIAVAKRGIEGSSWGGVTGTAVAEGSSEALVGLTLGLIAVAGGLNAISAPSPLVIGTAAAAGVTLIVFACRSQRLRAFLYHFVDGAAVLRDPRLLLRRVLPWQILGKSLRLAAIACFLFAFGLPVTPFILVTVCVVYGSGGALPFGAGTAAAAAGLLVALPAASGGPVDSQAVMALAIVQPALLTIVGVGLSTSLLATVLGVKTPLGIFRATKLLKPPAQLAIRQPEV